MAVHGPDVVATAKMVLPGGFAAALIFDHGQAQGTYSWGLWWRLEYHAPPTSALLGTLIAMLPKSPDVSVSGLTRAETCWYPEADLQGAIVAARAGTLDAWWQGKPSAQWWSGLPVEAHAGFTALLAGVNR